MALKKITRKLMREIFGKMQTRIFRGDFSRILETLGKYDVDLHTTRPDGCTFLWAVASCILQYGSPKDNANLVACMQFLIDHGADVNVKAKDGTTMLFMVAGADRSNPEAVELLIRNGADVHCLNNDGSSALVRAIAGFRNGYPEAFTPLLKAGADPYQKLNKEKSGWDTAIELVNAIYDEKQSQLKELFFNALKDLGKLKK